MSNTRPNNQKFFGPFFQKRTAFFLLFLFLPFSTTARTLLIAGDTSLPVFENAITSLARLIDDGPARLIHPRTATLDHVLAAVAGMKPAPGQGCLVFATSHGVKGEGFYLAPRDEVLTPRALDRALLLGCGTAPTVVVVSACYSGGFARAPMTRDNRIVITAARPDRTSFGCQAGRVYTVFDECLLGALRAAENWRQVFAITSRCIRAEERREGVTPSEPQGWFGSGVEKEGFFFEKKKQKTFAN